MSKALLCASVPQKKGFTITMVTLNKIFMMKVKIALVQKAHGKKVTHKDADIIRKFRPHFVCFPEYFFTNIALGHHVQTLHNFKRQLGRIETISKCLDTVVIGGTMHEIINEEGILHNTSYVFDRGKPVGSYRKLLKTEVVELINKLSKKKNKIGNFRRSINK